MQTGEHAGRRQPERVLLIGEWRAAGVLRRLVLLIAIAAIAYVISLQFIFPGYIATPMPFHNDMYTSLEFVANGWNFPFFLHWPRPVYFETLLFSGSLGLEGSLVFLTAIVLCDLALAVTLLERFILRRPIPWWLALGTMLLAMAGPGFYAQPAFDVGYHLALLFGTLGILAWEVQGAKAPVVGWLLTAACFCLSTLANEALTPVLFAYGTFSAFRFPGKPALAAAMFALPLLAIAVSFVDGQLMHSPFVAMHVARTDPYWIDFSAHSVLHCARYYVSGIASPAFLVLLLVCIPGLLYNRHLLAGAAFLVCGAALYTPYLLLPNHLDHVYQWAPMPLLMLIVPLAWTPSASARRAMPFSRLVLILVLGATIAFQTTQYLGIKAVYRTALDQNRAIVSALRSHSRQISASHSVLLRGLTFVTDPWAQNANAVSRIIPFSGEWSVETEPGYPPANEQPNARPVLPAQIAYKNYDLVLDFDRNGNITRAFRPSSFTPAPPEVQNEFYPDGILPPTKAALYAGVYPSSDRAQCCFLGGTAVLKLANPPNARTITLDMYVPDVRPFAGKAESIRITLNGKPVGGAAVLSLGANAVSISVTPAQARSQLVLVVKPSITFVPKDWGINGDVRRLSVMLLRVTYR